MGEEKLSVISTRMNFKLLEQKLKSIEKGHSLLKCKSDALQIHYRQIEIKMALKIEKMNEIFKRSFRLLNEAKYFGANVDVFRKECQKSPISLSTTISQICGVGIASFQITGRPDNQTDILWRGGSMLKEVKGSFDELLNLLVDLSSDINACEALKESLKATNKRKNALEHKMIPAIQATVKYVKGELDEMEREEFFRLKKVQASKNK